MDSRDRKNDFVTYLQAVGEKLGVKYSDADLYSSSKFLLMTTSDISQRFFDVKYSSYSFFQEDKKNAKREDEYTYSIPILSSDPVKNLSTAHRLVERQVVASANEVVNESRIQNILDDLDKDLIARPDWKQFWEEMEKQAPEKKSDIVKMQQYILNSYRFRAISMMAANLMSDVRGNITEEAKVNRLTLLLQKESGNRMRKMRSDSVPSKSAASSAEKTSSASILQVMAEKTGTAPAALVAASTRSQKLLAIEEMMLELEHKQNEKINTDRKGELEPIIAAQQSLAAYDRNMINSMFNAVMTIRQNYEKPQHKQGSKYAKRLQSLDKLENQCFDIVSKCIKNVGSDVEDQSKQIIARAYKEMEQALQTTSNETTGWRSSLKSQLKDVINELKAASKGLNVEIPSAVSGENKNVRPPSPPATQHNR